MGKTNIRTISTSFNHTELITTCQAEFDIPANNIPAKIISNIIERKYDSNNSKVDVCFDDFDNMFIRVNTFAVSAKHDIDEYDETIGEQVSEVKAQRSAFKIFKRIYKDCVTWALDLSDTFENLEFNTNKSIDSMNKHLESK